MKAMPARWQAAAKSLVFGKEAVAGMNRLGAALLCGGEDCLDVEIALGSWRRPDAMAFVRESYVQGAAIRVRIHRHAADCPSASPSA